jgi:very-short-patch-repair endonuclease
MRPAERACRDLAATQENLIRRDQAFDCGLSKSSIHRRVATGEWSVVLRGVYSIDAVDVTWVRKVRAAALWVGDRGALSHQTAAALWALDGFGPGPIVIASEQLLRPPPGISVHRAKRLAPADLDELRGLAVTSIERTLFDLSFLDAERTDVALDGALRSRSTSLAKLRWYLDTHGGRGRPGSAAMRRLLAERPAGYVPVDSPLEGRFWRLLVRSGLPRPVRQHEVLDAGRFVARVDMAYPEARVGIEVDGYRWHSGKKAWAHDLARRNRLTALGWCVLHITHDDLGRRPGEVVAHLRRVLEGRTSCTNLRSAKSDAQSSG